jgi:hypothetical protein
MKLVSRLAAAGTSAANSTSGGVTCTYAALTNSTSDTAIGTVSFPAGYFVDGKVIQFVAIVRSTATTSTDTLVVKAKFGGTAFFTSTAVDQADNDICVIRGSITVRDADSSGTVWCEAIGPNADATSTLATYAHAASIASLDFTAALTLVISGTWSAASASNSCQLEVLNVYASV